MKELEAFITPSPSHDQPLSHLPRDQFISSPSISQTPAITHSAISSNSPTMSLAQAYGTLALSPDPTFSSSTF